MKKIATLLLMAAILALSGCGGNNGISAGSGSENSISTTSQPAQEAPEALPPANAREGEVLLEFSTELHEKGEWILRYGEEYTGFERWINLAEQLDYKNNVSVSDLSAARLEYSIYRSGAEAEKGSVALPGLEEISGGASKASFYLFTYAGGTYIRLSAGQTSYFWLEEQAAQWEPFELREAGYGYWDGPDKTEDTLINLTTDMAIKIPSQFKAPVEGGEEAMEVCGPGQSMALWRHIGDIAFETPEFSGRQFLQDIYLYSQGGCTIILDGGAEEGYTLRVYDSKSTQPVQRYLLEPKQHYWLPHFEGQKLFLEDLPGMPMAELLELYPGAILPEGRKEVEWPGGYTMMFWCSEPLYNVKMSSTSYAGENESGGILYAHIPWDSLEGTTLMPDAPLFTSMVSPGSAWNLAVRFEDAGGKEYTYLIGENGRGGDNASLVIYRVNGVEFMPAE